MFPKLEFKRDPALLAFAALLVVGCGALMFMHVVTWKEGSAFLLAALAMPGLFGVTPKELDAAAPAVPSPLPKITYEEDEADPDTKRTP